MVCVVQQKGQAVNPASVMRTPCCAHMRMQAEALLGVGSSAAASGEALPWAWEQQEQQPVVDWQRHGSEHHQPQWGGWPADSLGGSDTAANEAGAAAPHRPPSAFSLGESALALRLTVHEKQMELLQLRAQHAALMVRDARRVAVSGLRCMPPVAGCRRLMCTDSG